MSQQLIVIAGVALDAIKMALVEATHSATNAAGERVQLATIDHRLLATAARVAMEIATGEVIWPEGERLRIARPRQVAGIFEEA